MAIVRLRDLKPNPYRDFGVDPIDPDNIAALRDSIKQDGFWGGIVCRKNDDGEVEIGAGHHRVEAAIKAGVSTADVFIGSLDDASMIRVYARENATQRGNTSTALAGSVASAIRYLTRVILTGDSPAKIFDSEHAAEKSREALTSKQGIGERVITRFLEGVPGINEGTVRQQLAVLKSSGDYARIVTDVTDQIEREHREAVKAAEAAEKARAKAEQAAAAAEAERKVATAKAKAARDEAEHKRAAHEAKLAEVNATLAEKRCKEMAAESAKFDALRVTTNAVNKAAAVNSDAPVLFDLEGVAKHLKNAHQLDTFRKLVTGQGVTPYLPVKNQAALAKALVKQANEWDRELSSAYISENLTHMVLNGEGTERRMSREEAEALKNRDFDTKMRHYMREFARNCRGMIDAGTKIHALMKEWPKGHAVPITNEFRSALRTTAEIVGTLSKRI